MSINPINSNPSISTGVQSLASVLQASSVTMPGITINPSVTGIAGSDTKVAQALLISLAQLKGPHNTYSRSYLNSTSLDSSQSIKVFLLTLMEALDFEHQKSIMNAPEITVPPNSIPNNYAQFHHPQAQSLLEDELLDLMDDVNSMFQSKSKSKTPIQDLEASAKKMFQNLGLNTDQASLLNLLAHMESFVIGSSNTGNFLNSQA
jgi:hypothetical protein